MTAHPGQLLTWKLNAAVGPGGRAGVGLLLVAHLAVVLDMARARRGRRGRRR